MTRAVRWLVAVMAAAVTFGVGVWVVRAVSWGWLPQGEGPRLDTALAFGTVVAGAVLAVGGWWASREQPQPGPAPVPAPAPRRAVTQEAAVSGNGRVSQAGGDRNPGRSSGPRPSGAAPSQVDQRAEASEGGSVEQTGGSRGTATGDAPDRVEQRAKASGRGRVEQAGGDQHVEGT